MLPSFKTTLITSAVISVATVAMLASTPAQAREQIRVVGSSTVYPFTSAAAEQFGQIGKFKTPIVESTGTGGGFKLFCAGVGDSTPDIANASRPITESEKAMCKGSGVNNVVEIMIGYDGIVLANAKGGVPLKLTKKQIFLALAREIPKEGKLVANTYQKWSEIDPALPNKTIEVYGPPPTSGTRDAFVELVMEAAAKDMPEFAAAYPDEKARKKASGLLREDGRYIDAGEDDNIIIQKLVSNKDAVGVFGYSFLDANKGKVQGATVDGVAPAMKSIEDGSYKVSRSLFIYVKGDHLGKIAGLAEFANEMVSEGAIGANGYLTAKGLLPLHEGDKAKARAAAASLKAAK